MTEWGMLLLCAYIALAATNRLTQRQAGGAALALTIVVVSVVMLHYRSATPTDKYIRSLDATVYLTGNPFENTGPPTTEDQSGVQAATWLTTDHTPGDLIGNTGDGG
ncbi:MAG TPA: hypothetical protein VMF07_17735 [Solirubrobacteraceae bacterium]|nr:hypothetical protein [Solirubrobacteraceae bacterium]